MSSSFQPDKPHSAARGSGSRGATLWTAGISAVLVFMLVALGMPFVLAFEEISWGIALGAAVLTFLVVLGIGFARRSGSPPTEKADETKAR